MKERQHYKSQARLLKALANETRLMIIDRLSQGRCHVGELVRLVGLDQSTVSKHLSVLRSVGVVEDERHGSTVYYMLVTPCVLDFFACTRKVLSKKKHT